MENELFEMLKETFKDVLSKAENIEESNLQLSTDEILEMFSKMIPITEDIKTQVCSFLFEEGYRTAMVKHIGKVEFCWLFTGRF